MVCEESNEITGEKLFCVRMLRKNFLLLIRSGRKFDHVKKLPTPAHISNGPPQRSLSDFSTIQTFSLHCDHIDRYQHRESGLVALDSFYWCHSQGGSIRRLEIKAGIAKL